MKLYEYKGYVIYPAPHLAGSYGYWKISLSIRYGETVKTYSNDSICFTKGEAVFNCIKYGKELIDNGVVMLDVAV
jgi:hypothetical protein